MQMDMRFYFYFLYRNIMEIILNYLIKMCEPLTQSVTQGKYWYTRPIQFHYCHGHIILLVFFFTFLYLYTDCVLSFTINYMSDNISMIYK